MLNRLKARAVVLLRWSEQYTKTDMVYLTKGGFWLALGHGVQMLSGLVLAVAFANLLPREAYGTYQFVMAGAAVLGACTLSGMGTAIMRTVARGSEGALRYGSRTQLVWSGGIVLLGGMLGLYYYINGNTTLATSFLIVGAFTPFLGSFGLSQPYLIGKQLFRENTMLGFWRRPLPVVALLSALYFTDNPVTLIFVYFSSNVLSAGLLYLLVVRRYNLPLTRDPQLLNYSKHLSALNIVSTLANQADKIAVWVFLGAAPLAIYTLATLPYTHFQKTFGLVGKLVFPKFATSDLQTLQRTLFSKVFVFFIAMLGAVALYFVMAPYIYRLFFPLYPEAILPSQVIMLALLAKPRLLYGQAFAAHGMKSAQYLLQISTAVVRVAFLLILLPLFGLWGAVYALLGADLYNGILSLILFHKNGTQ